MNSKFISCSQDWKAMGQVPGGRLCQACDKVLTDFSNLTWDQIDTLHASTDKLLCGKYLPEQLEERNLLPKKRHWTKALAVLALAAAFTFSSPVANAQTYDESGQIQTKEGVLSGRILSVCKTGVTVPSSFSNVFIRGTELGAQSDENGYFEVKIPDSLAQEELIIEVYGMAFASTKLEGIGSSFQGKFFEIRVLEVEEMILIGVIIDKGPPLIAEFGLSDVKTYTSEDFW